MGGSFVPSVVPLANSSFLDAMGGSVIASFLDAMGGSVIAQLSYRSSVIAITIDYISGNKKNPPSKL